MTHGELCFYKKENLDFKKSLHKLSMQFSYLPDPMSRSEAVVYYNTKLFNYWLSQMERTENAKEQLLYLMFGSGKRKINAS